MERTAPDFEAMRWALGFLFSRRPRFVPEHFRRLAPDLFVHPQTPVARKPVGYDRTILIGEAIDSHDPDLDTDAIVARLAGCDENAIVEYTGQLAGRWCLIYARGGVTKVMHDSIGLRPVYYARDGENGTVVASHHSLVERQLETVTPREPITINFGYPGHATPTAEVFLLPPNSRLVVRSGRVQRFFPLAPVPSTTVEDAAAYLAAVGQAVMAAAVRRHPVVMSITSGVDSRISLAFALPHKDRIRFFTYRSAGRYADPDIALPVEMAERFGLRHEVLEPGAADGGLTPAQVAAVGEARRNNTFGTHGVFLLPWYLNAFGQWEHVHVRSNMYEITRASFQYKRPLAPVTPADAGQFYISWVGTRAKPHLPEVTALFRETFAQTGWEEAVKYVAPHDLYFWEHRMACWQSNVVLESDLAFDTLILLNTRNVLTKVVGVPVEDRLKNAIVLRMLEDIAPELLEYPFNPEVWPPEASVPDGV